MCNIIEKIKIYLERKNAFKKASFVLQNGKYKIIGNSFYLIDNGDTRCKRYIRIKSKGKHSQCIKEGRYLITPYKLLFMNEEIVFSFVRGDQRFSDIKDNFNLYSARLPYKTMDCSFDDNEKLIVSNHVNGVQNNDENHMWRFIDYYFASIQQKYIEMKSLKMSSEQKNIFYYPQHGDCHSKNIFWKENTPTLIDIDDVDSYPLFYDVFYYVIASKHEDAFIFFRTKEFVTRLNKFCLTNKFKNDDIDIVDFYLGAYAYFWINKMKKKMKFHEIYFYLKWFLKGDLSSYPIVSLAIEEYTNNLKKMRIKDEKR